MGSIRGKFSENAIAKQGRLRTQISSSRSGGSGACVLNRAPTQMARGRGRAVTDPLSSLFFDLISHMGHGFRDKAARDGRFDGGVDVGK